LECFLGFICFFRLSGLDMYLAVFGNHVNSLLQEKLPPISFVLACDQALYR
jgi:hypothetical protein